MTSHDIAELVDFQEQPDGALMPTLKACRCACHAQGYGYQGCPCGCYPRPGQHFPFIGTAMKEEERL